MVVADVLELLQPTVGARKELVLTADYAQTVPDMVCTDALRLQQILVNLVGNAIKYTDRGRVVMRVEPAAPGPTRTPCCTVRHLRHRNWPVSRSARRVVPAVSSGRHRVLRGGPGAGHQPETGRAPGRHHRGTDRARPGQHVQLADRPDTAPARRQGDLRRRRVPATPETSPLLLAAATSLPGPAGRRPRRQPPRH